MPTEPLPRRRQMSRPRVAEMIANEIRQRILDGQLVDGDMLPKVDDMVDDYRVSKPSIREAMRILETEGLVSARRGGAGGAEVHMPTASTAAHTLGMILQSTHATVAELATALLVLEPTCAAKTAEREDRADAVIPQLRALHRQLEERRGDPTGFSMVARQFHQAIVGGCGNAALELVAGALESLWSQHESTWLEFRDAELDDDEVAVKVLEAHARILDAIESGDAREAQSLVAQHLAASQTYVLSESADLNITVAPPYQHPY
jgi:GntR family transcriptional regulator, transcriptional repressor for pyruvate dehydrogenase complex